MIFLSEILTAGYLVLFFNRARESRSLVSRSQKNSSTTKAKHYLESLRISEQISNALTGFELQFCRNSLRVDTGVIIRIFCKG